MTDSPAYVTLEAVDGEHETLRYDAVTVLDSGALHCRNGTHGGGDVVEITYHSPLSWHTVEIVPQEDRDTDQSWDTEPIKPHGGTITGP